jgi:hypothetical protein
VGVELDRAGQGVDVVQVLGAGQPRALEGAALPNVEPGKGQRRVPVNQVRTRTGMAG